MDMKSMVDGQLRASRNITLQGKIIDHNLGDIIIFIPCLCVQDTPENPCPCKDLRFVIDLRDVEGKPSKTKLKSVDGESIFSIEINRNANVMVETSSSVPIDQAAEFNIGLSPSIVGLAGAAIGQAALGELAKNLLEWLERLKTDQPVEPPFPDDATPTLLPAVAAVIVAGIGLVGTIATAILANPRNCKKTVNVEKLPNGGTRTITEEVCTSF